MKIAVVGGGIFGVTAAIELARAGFSVDLFERYSDILQAASGINQYRLHRGYHYPRSPETIVSCLQAEATFRQEFGSAVIDDSDHYYCIAAEQSLISGEQYLQICRDHGLEFEVASSPLLNSRAIQLCLKVKESLFDSHALRELCRAKLKTTQVNVYCNREVVPADLGAYDYVAVCTYAAINPLLSRFPEAQRNYQFELCEKLVLELPNNFQRQSIVILDGPFTCIDPYGRSNYHVMGSVVHASHASNIGRTPIIPELFKPLLNRGVITNPSTTNFGQFIAAAKHFIPEIVSAKHIGSMFTIRTVLPHLDKTDARPTLVEVIDERLIPVFSGKIGNCVLAAREVRGVIEELTKKQSTAPAAH